jgi:hypothetical protein
MLPWIHGQVVIAEGEGEVLSVNEKHITVRKADGNVKTYKPKEIPALLIRAPVSTASDRDQKGAAVFIPAM